MASSEVEVCNLALTWLAVDPITSLDDPQVEAQVCKANFASARDATLEDGDWSFAIRYTQPAMVGSPAVHDPRPPLTGNLFWKPTDVLRIVRADDGSDDWRQRWLVVGEYIVSDTSTLYIETVVLIEDTTRWSPTFSQAVAARLAADTAMTFTESRSMRNDMWQLYEQKVSTARANDGRQGTSQKRRSDRLRLARR